MHPSLVWNVNKQLEILNCVSITDALEEEEVSSVL